MDKNRGERNIMEQKNNPKISFENYRINKLLLRDLEEGEKEGQIGISIGLNDKKNQVKLGIDIATKTRFVEIEMLGVFEFDEKTPEDEKEKFLEKSFDHVTKEALGIIKYIVRKQRLSLVSDIKEYFLKLYYEENNKLPITASIKYFFSLS